MRHLKRSWLLIASMALLAATFLHGAPPTYAQAERCFSETGYCISGRFRQYWEQNGGLAVFGYPITPAADEVNREDGKTYLTQWFQRNRFELHPENRRPYDVLLGRLGDDSLVGQDRDWRAAPTLTGPPGDLCYFAKETGHAICGDFFIYFRTHGLEFDGRRGFSEAESIALFGLPLTEPQEEVNPTNGQTYMTQYTERARFEWHPENPDPYKVLLGLLGTELCGHMEH